MANDIENLEFVELPDLTVTEDDSNLFVVGYDRSDAGKTKAYPLGNKPSKEYVDKGLGERATQIQLGATNKEIEALKKGKAENSALQALSKDVEENSATKKELEEVKIIASNAQSGMNPMGKATNEADLNSKPKRNNDAYFRLDTVDAKGNPYIWRYDAELAKWINTFQITYVKDAATNEDLEALDEATKAAQEIYFFDGTALWGVTTKGRRKIMWLDFNGKLHVVAGLSDDLIETIKPKLFTYTIVANKQYLWAVLSVSGRILLGVKINGDIIGNIPLVNLLMERFNILRMDVDKLKQGLPTLRNFVRTIACFGDSLTAGGAGGVVSYVPRLQQKLGNAYNIINCGVGGESAATISARQGGVIPFIIEGFVLPAGTAEVEISSQSNYRIKNKFGKIITPLLQGQGHSVNPCYVNNIECTMSYNYDTKIWYIKRNEAVTQPTTIAESTPLYFNGSVAYDNIHASIFFFGANNGIVNGSPVGHDSDEQLVQYYRNVIAYSKTKNYLIIGIPNRNNATGENLERLMSEEFGNRYFNWRKYAVENGLSDAGITSPTQADINAVSIGEIPPSLKVDNIHYTDACYEKVLTPQIENKLTELGII